MDPKLTILYCLIGIVIGFSHLSGEKLGELKRQLNCLRWREVMLSWRKIGSSGRPR